MTRFLSLLGLMVAASLGVIAWIGLPVADSVAGQNSAATSIACAAGEIALDEGYGISRRIPCAER